MYSSIEKIAPYLFDHKVETVYFSHASDVWSVGCIFTEFLLQVSPHFTHLQVKFLDKDGKKGETKDTIVSLLLKLANLLGRDLVENAINHIGIYKLTIPQEIPAQKLDLSQFMKEHIDRKTSDSLMTLMSSMLNPNPKERSTASVLTAKLSDLIEILNDDRSLPMHF